MGDQKPAVVGTKIKRYVDVGVGAVTAFLGASTVVPGTTPAPPLGSALISAAALVIGAGIGTFHAQVAAVRPRIVRTLHNATSLHRPVACLGRAPLGNGLSTFQFSPVSLSPN